MKTINWEENNNYLTTNVIDLPKSIQKKIYSENKEYLKWCDGSQITHSDLAAYFLINKYESGAYSLTHKDEDFYINDIIFTEK